MGSTSMGEKFSAEFFCISRQKVLDLVRVLTLCIMFDIYLSIRVVYSLMVPMKFHIGIPLRSKNPPMNGGLLFYELTNN